MSADVFFHLFPTLSSLYFLLLPSSSSLAPPLFLMDAATSRGAGAPSAPLLDPPLVGRQVLNTGSRSVLMPSFLSMVREMETQRDDFISWSR